MNILLIGPLFANAGHGAECGVYDALRELGHEVSAFDLRQRRFIDSFENQMPNISSVKTLGQYDVVLCLGPGLHPSLQEGGFEQLKGFKILWNSEPIRLDTYRKKVETQRDLFDLNCTFDEGEIPLYKEIGVKRIEFLPQAFNPKWYRPVGGKVSKDFCFVGSIGGKWANRVPFLNAASEICNSRGWTMSVHQRVFDAVRVNAIYQAHKVVLNVGLYHPELGPPTEFKSFGLQQRIFEAIGAGRICVTNHLDRGTNEILIDNQDVIYYTTESLEWAMDYAFNYWEDFSDNVNKIREKHTYKARMEKLLSFVT